MTTQKERELNSMLAMVLKPDGEGYSDPHHPYRRLGKTFRSILHSLTWASANPDQRVLHMNLTPVEARHSFEMTCSMTAAINRKISPENRTIRLDNGSVIEFWGAGANLSSFYGKRYDGIAKDFA